ncbi:hypothetical protein D3C87_1910960 [compost metagenome]
MISFAELLIVGINFNAAFFFYFPPGRFLHFLSLFYFALWQIPFFISENEKIIALCTGNQATGCLNDQTAFLNVFKYRFWIGIQ